MAEQFLAAAERWALTEKAQAARWRVWGRGGAHIPMVVAIQLDQGDNELLVKMIATWDRFTGSLWMGDPGAIVEEWAQLTYYHSAWLGWSAVRVPAEARAQWTAELDPFREVVAASRGALAQSGASAISTDERLEGLAWANSALAHRRWLVAGEGFRHLWGDFRKYLTQAQIRQEETEEFIGIVRRFNIREAQEALFDRAQRAGKPH